jgi:hypothetical protein
MHDSIAHARTVWTMTSTVSRPVPEGHLVLLVADSDNAAILGRFVDDGSVRDMTDYAADLVLVGLSSQVEADTSGRPAPAETAGVAEVELVGCWQGWYVHHPSGTVAPIDEATLLHYVATGAAQAITAGVAAALAEDLPDSPDGVGETL